MTEEEEKNKERNVLNCRVHTVKNIRYMNTDTDSGISHLREWNKNSGKETIWNESGKWMKGKLEVWGSKIRWTENKAIERSIKNERQQPKWWTTRHDRREIWYDVWGLNCKKGEKQKKWISNDLERGVAF